MEPLRILTSTAASLPLDDIDTDIIYPARFLLITEKKGLGRYAFADRRDDPDFPIGSEGVGDAQILVAGRNFGSGSSREQAAWALDGLGLRMILAPSFGEIFYSNCFKNGMLPIRLSEEECARAHQAARAGELFTADLEACTIASPSVGTLNFTIEPDRREALLNGWNEIARIRALHSKDIENFEAVQREAAPWLWIKDSLNA